MEIKIKMEVVVTDIKQARKLYKILNEIDNKTGLTCNAMKLKKAVEELEMDIS